MKLKISFNTILQVTTSKKTSILFLFFYKVGWEKLLTSYSFLRKANNICIVITVDIELYAALFGLQKYQVGIFKLLTLQLKVLASKCLHRVAESRTGRLRQAAFCIKYITLLPQLQTRFTFIQVTRGRQDRILMSIRRLLVYCYSKVWYFLIDTKCIFLSRLKCKCQYWIKAFKKCEGTAFCCVSSILETNVCIRFLRLSCQYFSPLVQNPDVWCIKCLLATLAGSLYPTISCIKLLYATWHWTGSQYADRFVKNNYMQHEEGLSILINDIYKVHVGIKTAT